MHVLQWLRDRKKIMTNKNLAYLRKEIVPEQPAPIASTGIVGWA